MRTSTSNNTGFEVKEVQTKDANYALKHLSSRHPARATRDDGASTKRLLIEAGGEVFAEKGYAYATGKEITEQAGVNSAAINYHFGGVHGLYLAVLTEAHNRVADLAIMEKVVSEDLSAVEKLIRLTESVLKFILTPANKNWELKLLGREILNPASNFYSSSCDTITQKQQIIVNLISEILHVQPSHPAVARCLFTIVSPIESLLADTPAAFSYLKIGEFRDEDMDMDDTINHICSFIEGGLNTIAKNISIMECKSDYHDSFF